MMTSTLISRVANLFGFSHFAEEPKPTTSQVCQILNEDKWTDDSDYHTLPGSILSIDGQPEENSEDPLKDTDVIGQNELENDYSLSSAQWTPEWPSDLEEKLKDIKCTDIDPSVKSSSEPTKGNKRTLKRVEDLSETSSNSESSDSDAAWLFRNSKSVSKIKDRPFIDSRAKKVIKLSSDLTTEDWKRESLERWPIDFGSNRNYIKSMVNQTKSDWASMKCSSGGVNGGWRGQDGQWTIVYDNKNYIRTQVHPELLKRGHMNRQGIGFQKQCLYNFA